MPSSAEHRPFRLDESLAVRDPIVVSPETAVLEAIAQMYQAQATAPDDSASPWAPVHQRVRGSCVLLVEQGQCTGMLTEQDVVRLVAQSAGDPKALGHTSAGQVAQAAVTLRQRDWVDVAAAIALIRQQGASHLVILDDQDYPIGLATYETLQPALEQALHNQRRIEALLADSERRYACLTAAAPVGIFRTDLTGQCTYVNEYYCQILQMASEAVLGQSWDYRLHPEDRGGVLDAWHRSAQASTPFVFECRLYRADGAVVWVYNRSVAEHDSSGQLMGYVGAVTDISERKRTEIELQQREAQSRALLVAIPDHMVRIGADGVYREVVTPKRDLDVIPQSVDPIGQPMQALLPEAVVENKYRYMAQALQTGELQVYEQQVQNRDRLQYEEVRVIKSGDDEVLFMIRDISDRKRAELLLQGLAEGTAATTGEAFFAAFVESVTQALQVSHALISERYGEELRMVGFWARGALRPNVSYAIESTLCERTLHEGEFYFESDIPYQFPKSFGDIWSGLRSYLGVTLSNGAGEAIGTLCILDSKPIQNSERANQILRIFAARAAAELERQQAISSLERLNQQLEANVQARTAELQEKRQFLQTVLDTMPIPIFWKNRDSIVLGCNEHFATTLGFTSTLKAIGTNTFEHTAVRREAEGFIADDRQVMESGLPKLGIEEVLSTINGEWKLLETNKAPLRNLAGEVIGIVATFQDITKRKQAEQQLQDSEQRFRSAIANAPFPISIHAEDGEMLQISATWTELTGYTHADIPTTAIWAQRAYGDRAEYVLENYINKLYTLESRWDEGEFTITTRDGSQRIWQFSSAPLGALSDGRRLATSMAVDITERRQAELALQESEERYRAIYDQAALGLISFNIDGSIIDANPSFCRMMGYSREELLSKTALELTHPEDSTEFFSAVAHLFTSGKPSLFQEKRCLCRDGSFFWAGATVSVVRSTSGQIKHALGILQDISARKQHEAERERAEAQSQALLRQSQLLNRIGSEIRASLELDAILYNLVHAIVAELPVDGCTFGWYTPPEESGQGSAQLEVIWEKKVLRSTSCLGIYSNDLCPVALERIANDQPFRVDKLTPAPDAAMAQHLERINISVYFCLPVHTPGEKIGCLQLGRIDADQLWTDEEIELFHSIANQVAIAIYQAQLYEESQAKTREIERSYQELQEAQIHMVQAEKMSSLGQLVAGIAHEINNPVGFIYGNLAVAKNYVSSLTALVQGYQQAYPEPPQSVAQLLEQADIDYIFTDFPKLLASMENGATRIQAIVQSLRTFSRLEQVGQSAVDINQRIESTLVILQNRLNGRAGSPEIEVVKRYGNLPQIECYGSLLDQVFINLLVNAIDAIEERQSMAGPDYAGQISITTAIATGRVLISIQDNGAGMDTNTQANIFNPFFTTKPIGVGTGMGLSISYQIVTGNHNGRLYCRSLPGEGTEFVIELPRALD